MQRTKYIFFNPSIIQDHNSEGFDSVDSEDFGPGFGCVPVFVERELPPPPPVPDNRTASDKENDKYFFTTDAQKQRMEDEFLNRFGL